MNLPMIDIKGTPPAHLANGQRHDASVKKAELLLTQRNPHLIQVILQHKPCFETRVRKLSIQLCIPAVSN
ncbi:hypothetical protein AO286_12340 [Pseudomonas syringae]|nr:hypothetical protein AL046_26730 [Pseudomonas syringae pv. avii]PHN65388.1 hypothetical protein AO286_12340 [Pseudomonas syringae]